MTCPKCNEEFNFLHIAISKTNNLRAGFFCPKCNCRLKVSNYEDIEQKSGYFSKTIAPLILLAIIYLAVRIFNKNIADVLVPFLIAGASITMIFYFSNKFLNKQTNLIIDEEFEKQQIENKNIQNKK